MTTTDADPDYLPRDWHSDSTLRDIVHAKIAERYALGQNDQQIARSVGVASLTVLRWRRRRYLPANHQPGPRVVFDGTEPGAVA